MSTPIIQNLEKLLDGPRDGALLRYGLGNEWLKAGDLEQAALHLQEAVRRDPNYSAAWKLLGKALAAGNRPEAALEEIARVLVPGGYLVVSDLYLRAGSPGTTRAMAKITIDRGSIVHDDRLDALEGAVRYWQDKLAIDQQESVARQREKDYLAMIADPLGKRRNDPPKRGSLFNKYAR